MSPDIETFDLPKHPIDAPGVHILEADAGTGKTYSLTGLILRLLVEEGLPHDRLLAVTFSEAAAGEIAERVRARLREAREDLANPEGDETEPLVAHWRSFPEIDGRPFVEIARNRVDAALLVADDLRISTIHAFCARLLGEHAFDSGMPLVAELGASEDALRTRVIRDYLRSLLYDAPMNLVAMLEEKGVDEDFLQKIARRVPDAGDAPGRPPQWHTGDEPRPDTREAVVSDFTGRVPALFRDAKLAAGLRSFDDLIRDAARAVNERPALREILRARTSVALIDEFQDTDSAQLSLFTAIFGSDGPRDSHRLFYIGDPKQSIYRFRGADLDAYLEAVRNAREGGATVRRLDTNWRSSKAMIDAANALFRPDSEIGKRGLFPETADFAFRGVKASDRADSIPDLFRQDGSRVPALNMVWCASPDGDDFTPLGPSEANEPIADHVALSIASHLRNGNLLKNAKGEARPACARDFAVLVADRYQAAAVIEALRQVGVPAVSAGARGVFAGRAASELRILLHALLNPRDNAVVRAVFAGPFHSLTAAEIAGLDESAWQDLLESLDRHRTRWLRDGFAAFFDALLADGEFMRRHLGLIGGERDFADWRQLSEILSEREHNGHLAPEALLRFLITSIAESQENDEELKERLESDRDAVRVLTMHASKGLEFPIVYVPFAWKVRAPRKGAFVAKKPSGSLHVVPANDRSEEDQTILESEKSAAFADMRRLLYVAVTRAKSACYLYTGAILSSQGGVNDGPMNELVHRDCTYAVINRKMTQITGPNLKEPIPYPPPKSKNPKPPVSVAGPDSWSKFAKKYAVGILSIIADATVGLPARRIVADQPQDFKALTFPVDRIVDARPIQTSYSGLIHGLVAGASEVGRRHDETSAEDLAEAGAVSRQGTGDPLAFLPAGATTGTLIHDILEEIDFAAPDIAIIEKKLREARRPVADAPRLLAAIRDWCGALLSPETGDTFTLADIPPEDRLPEMGFDLPATLDTPHRLADAMRSNPAVPRELVRRLAGLSRDTLDGYLIGFIDLVFRRNGRYYILDWKTNRLGADRTDYTPAAIRTSMTSHGYHLQYHLYLLALDSHLRATLRDTYEPDKHLGGVFYLYVRGLHPDSPGAGVHYDRPTPAVVDALRSALHAEPRTTATHV